MLEGIAPDGGLYVTDAISRLSVSLSDVVAGSYLSNARLVLGKLLDDLTADEIATCVARAYGSTFDTPEVTPVTPMGQDWLLELSHGPTCAFKDVALQMLPKLLSVARADEDEQVLVVTATSGDTGKAALEGFADVPGTQICVFYPAGGVSDVQRLQMVTQTGSNVLVYGVNGNFDDVQTAVKQLFADEALAGRLAARKVRLSSANSINIGRLAPQVVYYFDAYAQLVRKGAVQLGQEVEFCVPTGNFGNVLAGYYAKLMGLPVSRFIVASNSNDVLTDFITSGTYDRSRPFWRTISPSMDILVSSNLERLLWLLSDGDVELVAHLMHRLAEDGSYTVPGSVFTKLRQSFACGKANDSQTMEAIRHTWQQTRVLLDTHTAVAKHVADAKERTGAARVVLMTASPFKFPTDVLTALGGHVGKSGFDDMDELERISGIAAPSQLSVLRSTPEIHKGICDVPQMRGVVEAMAMRATL